MKQDQQIPEINYILHDKELEFEEKKPIITLTLIGVIVSIVISILTYNFLLPENAAIEKTLFSGSGTEGPIQKVAYIAKNNVWYFDLKTYEHIQLTKDGSTTTRYSGLAWKNSKELSFAQCVYNQCSVFTYNLEENQIDINTSISAQTIPAIRWSHDKKNFAFISESATNSAQLFYTEAEENTQTELRSFQLDTEREASFDDAVYIRFSPKDTYVMAVHTYVADQEPSVFVTTRRGNEVVSQEKSGDMLPTFGYFADNTLIHYKKKDALYYLDLETGEEKKIAEGLKSAYGFQSSPSRDYSVYWNYDSNTGLSTSWFFDTEENTSTNSQEQYAQPHWIDNETVVMFKTAECIECLLSDITFDRIIEYNLSTKQVTPLIEKSNIREIATNNV